MCIRDRLKRALADNISGTVTVGNLSVDTFYFSRIFGTDVSQYDTLEWYTYTDYTAAAQIFLNGQELVDPTWYMRLNKKIDDLHAAVSPETDTGTP